MREVSEKPRGAGYVIFAALRVTAALVCAFLLYTFLFTASLRQINVGNIVGSVFCIAVILLVVLYPFMRRRKRLRIAAKVCGAGLVLFAVYCGCISCLIASEMIRGDRLDAAMAAANMTTPETVIVLGCKTIDGAPSPMLKLRLDKAAEYLNINPAAVCIVTGGQGWNETEPEALTMRKYLISQGISDDRIHTEDRSVNTTENIQFAADIIAEKGLPAETVIVSECYHIYRGVRQAKLAGLNASGIYPDPSSVLITMPSYWTREIFAVSRDLFLA